MIEEVCLLRMPPALEAWPQFPNLTQLSDELQKILEPLDRGSATAGFLWAIATRLSGVKQLSELLTRLAVVQLEVATGLASGRSEQVAAKLPNRRPVVDQFEPATMYVYLCMNEEHAQYSRRELLASLALWSLAESERRAKCNAPAQAMAMQAQAALCLTFALSEEAALLSGTHQISLARDKRAKQASRGGYARHKFLNDIKQQLLMEFKERRWPTKAAAARELAKKYGFVEQTVTDWIRDTELTWDSATPWPIRGKGNP